MANVVSNQLVLICFAVSLVITTLCLLLNRQILGLIYGSVEPEVMEQAVLYFYITSFSFPFISVYYGATALFRSMGNSKLSLYVSGTMNVLNIIGEVKVQMQSQNYQLSGFNLVRLFRFCYMTK